MKKHHIILACIIVTLGLVGWVFISQSNDQSNSLSIEEILEMAGGNKYQIRTFLTNHSDNKEKTDAAKFIVNGLPGMVNYDSSYLDAFDTVLSYSQNLAVNLENTGLNWRYNLKFIYYDSMINFVKRWKEKTNIDGPGEYKLDLNNVTSEYLDRNLDLAFRTRNDYPWTKNLSTHDFHEYVLPHAWGSGSLNNWRGELYHRFNPIASHRIMDGDSAMRGTVNDILKSMGQLYFTLSLNPYIGYLDYDRIISAKSTSCVAKAKANIQALRSVGVPVTIDFYQFPANQSSTGHEWNVIVLEDSSWSFDPFWLNIDELYLNGAGEKHIHNNKYKTLKTIRISKVFRQEFSFQSDPYQLVTKLQGDVPEYFKNVRVSDVTHSYLDVSDVELEVNTGMEYVYICNFTLDHVWKPVFWAKVNNSRATFSDMGRDVAYIVMSYKKGVYQQLSSPFVLTKSGKIEWLNPNYDEPIDIKLTELRFEHAEDNDKSTKLAEFKNKVFELFYWDNNGWNSLGVQSLISDHLLYKNAPSNCMYLLKHSEAEGKERIFTYENGMQKWW